MEKIFGDLNEKEVKKVAKIVDRIEEFDEETAALTDEELKAKTPFFKERLASGEEDLDDILPEAFAVAREAAWRVLGMKPFRVQLMGGVVMHQGRIAEMKTGEGKTLAATLPVYLNALEGKGVHVVTVNDYLAKRDMEWMGKIYTFLGLKIGCVIHGISDEARRAAYQADVTYGTNNEYGFDYLRDNMVIYKEDMMQRELNYAIVDEVDSILIDEARTPLIISGQGDKSTVLYAQADRFVRTLHGGIKDENDPKDEPDDKYGDYVVFEKDKQVAFTDAGIHKCEEFFKIDNFADPENMEINHHCQQALKAHALMHRDIDYIVKDGEVIIVDEFTGRLMFGRRYSDGLHQAIEQKEGVSVRSESKTLATITLQNYFRMYQKLAGMTGTAKTEEDEFRDIYNMDVVVVPTNKPMVREDDPDAIFATEKGKYHAIVEKILAAHETGMPVLVGTISIEKSEIIADMLSKRGVKNFSVLNAKQHDKEAAIIAEAGRKGAITIATNMAGRGTDIILGGNPEFEALKELEKEGFSADAVNEANSLAKTDDQEIINARKRFEELHDKFKEERKEEQETVRQLGGLCIIGTERHESRRIDNQLRGRSGRQGDPGLTQFCISLEDDLMRMFGGERMKNVVDKLGVAEDDPIESGMVSKSIENAQKKVEGRNFSIRKYVLQYDNVMNKQREIIYEQRRMVLFGEDLKSYIMGMAKELIEATIDPITMASKFPEEWDYDALNKNLKKICPRFKGVHYDDEDFRGMDEDVLHEDIMNMFDDLYTDKEKEVGEETMRELERMILIRVVDNKWMDHIDAMDQLKNGIGLRGLGGQDPAGAYADEGFAMFEEMINAIKEETVMFCYNVTVETQTARRNVIGSGEGHKDEFDESELAEDGMIEYEGSGTTSIPGEQGIPDREEKQTPFKREHPKVGRNDPCWCGSGKKYKYCHMESDLKEEQNDN